MFSFRVAQTLRLSKAGRVIAGFGISAIGIGSYIGFTAIHAREERIADVAQTFMGKPLTDIKTLEKNKDSMRTKMEVMILKAQGEICRKLSDLDGKKFQVDRWERQQGGGGMTCVIQDGKVFEKAGVNVSVVYGTLAAKAAQQMKSRGKGFKGEDLPFFACGISSVIHPRNPYVPTVHFNYRYFEVTDIDGQKHAWFGGGTDLTPYYLNEQVKNFHETKILLAESSTPGMEYSL